MFKKVSFILLTMNLTHNVFAENNSDKFINESQQIIQNTVSQFQEKIEHPLNARMFDISKPSYYDFLTYKSGKHNYNNDNIAIVYYEGNKSQFKVNNKVSSFCFILNNTNDKQFLPNYLKSGFFNWQSMVQYINYHELGHCFSYYEGEFNSDKIIKESKLKEAFADMYAIALFYSQGNTEQVTKIIEFNAIVPQEDIHSNTALLKNFYNQLKEYQEISSHPKDVLDLTYIIFNKIK